MGLSCSRHVHPRAQTLATTTKLTKLIEAALRSLLKLVSFLLLRRTLSLPPGLSEFRCSSLWSFCSRGVRQRVRTFATAIYFISPVPAACGSLLELVFLFWDAQSAATWSPSQRSLPLLLASGLWLACFGRCCFDGLRTYRRVGQQWSAPWELCYTLLLLRLQPLA